MDEILRAEGWAEKAQKKYAKTWRVPIGAIDLERDREMLVEACSFGLTEIAGEPVTATQFDLVRADKVIQYEP